MLYVGHVRWLGDHFHRGFNAAVIYLDDIVFFKCVMNTRMMASGELCVCPVSSRICLITQADRRFCKHKTWKSVGCSSGCLSCSSASQNIFCKGTRCRLIIFARSRFSVTIFSLGLWCLAELRLCIHNNDFP